MRKSVVILLILACQTTFAKDNLPFVGTGHFNLHGGSGTWESITITKNGHMKIQQNGTSGTYVSYSGKYKNPVCVNNTVNGEFICYKITKNKEVQFTNTEGEILEECYQSMFDEEASLCNQKLRFDEPVRGLAGIVVD